MSKRILVVILTVCLAVVGMTVMAVADTVTGTGWSLDTSTGVLTFSSDAGMNNWTDNDRNTYGESVKSVIIESGVTYIRSYAFYYYCTNLESVSIPDTVTTIGDHAFHSCSSLTSITIPDTVTTIGDRVFYNCTKLASVTLGSSVQTIGESAFAYTSLTSIVIPDTVTVLGSSVFCECTSLVSAVIGDGVTSIGSFTFYNCIKLTSIYVGSSVTSIDNAFSLSYSNNTVRSITDIYYAGTENEWSALSSNLGSNASEAFVHCNSTEIHTYALGQKFTWSEDYSKCTFSFVCSECGSAKSTYDCAVNSVTTTEASCTETGLKNCKATVTVGNVEYTDEENVVVAALGHNLTKTEAVAATCTTDGNIEYWYCSTCDQYFSDEDCTTVILLTDTVIAASHSYYVSSCTWYDNYTSATLKLVCDSCGDEIEIDATEITSEEDGSGNVVYKATVRYGNINYSQITTVEAEEKSSSKSDIYTTLSRIQASYTGVQAAIEKANSLNPDDYENFSAVTEAIEAVDWSLNVLNQREVNAYAEAIEEAIENLVPVETVDITEETIEIVDPVEAGETDIE